MAPTIQFTLLLFVGTHFINKCGATPTRTTQFDDKECAIIVAALGFYYLLNYYANYCVRAREEWVNPYLQKRNRKGRYRKDFQDMVNNPRVFNENFHMSIAKFRRLHDLVEGALKPVRRTRPRDEITTEMRLAITLEYLASGTMQRHLACCYRISKQATGHIIEQTCRAITAALQPLYIKPVTKEMWLEVSNNYNYRWNVPNCLGSIDGKHVAIRCPQNGASLFYNYKGFHSIVLMAVADAHYRFIYVDIGAYGSEGDSSVFRVSSFGKALRTNSLYFPPRQVVHGQMLPFYFLADDAFPLTQHIMKPYKPDRGQTLSIKKDTFNYRLSRGHRCVENAFGILCARWCCLSKPLVMKPERVQDVVNAACMLHNYLLSECPQNYCPPGFADYFDLEGNICDGVWRSLQKPPDSRISNLEQQYTGRPTNDAKAVRRHLKDYFCSPEGSLPWQPLQP